MIVSYTRNVCLSLRDASPSRHCTDTRRAAAWQWSAVTAETARTSLRAHDMQMPRPYMAGTSLRHGPADNHGHEWIPAASSTPGLT
jgi:hypothetical protein